MNTMKRTAKIVMTAAAALCAMSLAACGDTAESSSKTGTVSLVTTTTTAAPESSKAETTTTAAESEAETTTTTTTAQTTAEAEATTTTEAQPEPETADKLAVNFSGKKISVGESFADAESRLSGYVEHFVQKHCTDDGEDDVYEYDGMEVVVFEGKISRIMLYNSGTEVADPPYAECGLKVGMTDPKAILGEPIKENETDSKYEFDGKYVYVSMEDGKARVIMIAELETSIPDFS